VRVFDNDADDEEGDDAPLVAATRSSFIQVREAKSKCNE